MLIGYARVSTQDQTLDLQTDALSRAGCEKIFTDTTSGAKAERPGLQEAMNQLRADDTLVVWRLDRLGRTLKHLIATISDLSEQGIGFKSVQENMDTTTSGGKLIFHIFGALAEFERESSKNAPMQDFKPRGHEDGSAADPGSRHSTRRKPRWRKNSMPSKRCLCRKYATRFTSGARSCIGTSRQLRAPSNKTLYLPPVELATDYHF